MNIGDEVRVMVIEVDRLGRINLSRRAVLQGLTPEMALATAPAQPNGGGPRGGDRDRRPDFRRGGPPRGGNGGGRDRFR